MEKKQKYKNDGVSFIVTDKKTKEPRVRSAKRLAKLLEEKMNKLEDEGYEVSVFTNDRTPGYIILGTYAPKVPDLATALTEAAAQPPVFIVKNPFSVHFSRLIEGTYRGATNDNSRREALKACLESVSRWAEDPRVQLDIASDLETMAKKHEEGHPDPACAVPKNLREVAEAIRLQQKANLS